MNTEVFLRIQKRKKKKKNILLTKCNVAQLNYKVSHCRHMADLMNRYGQLTTPTSNHGQKLQDLQQGQQDVWQSITNATNSRPFLLSEFMRATPP